MLTFYKIPLRKQGISPRKIGLERKFNSPQYEVSKTVPTSKNEAFQLLPVRTNHDLRGDGWQENSVHQSGLHI